MKVIQLPNPDPILFECAAWAESLANEGYTSQDEIPFEAWKSAAEEAGEPIPSPEMQAAIRGMLVIREQLVQGGGLTN